MKTEIYSIFIFFAAISNSSSCAVCK